MWLVPSHHSGLHSDVTSLERASLSTCFKSPFSYITLSARNLQIFFYEIPDSKCFRLEGHMVSVNNYSTLPLLCKSSHRLYVNEWVFLCFNNTLFMKTGGRLDLAHWL